LNEIINGKRPVTADLAILLEKTLEIPAGYWMSFQTQYEIDKARIKEKNIKRLKSAEIWKIVKEYVPVRFLRKLNYLNGDIESNIQKIKDIYKIKNIEELVNLTVNHKNLAFYRKSSKLNINDINMLGWSKVAEFAASEIIIAEFDKRNILHLLSRLREVFFSNNQVINNVKKELEKYGVKFILLDKFEKTPIDGYSFWSGKNPAIAVTLRHKRIDNFAFTIFHELGHIFLHISKDNTRKFLDVAGFENKDSMENDADIFARDNLIPPEQWNILLLNSKILDDKNILAFSAKYKINPAIVLGRLSWETEFYKFKSEIDRSLY
jgi:HTH-type transcriptional regulator/antitoxin HigA